MAAMGVGLRVLQCWAIPILGPWAGTGPSEFLPRQGGPEPSFASTGLRHCHHGTPQPLRRARDPQLEEARENMCPSLQLRVLVVETMP